MISTNYIRGGERHVPQLGSCTFERSIYYNQHMGIFRILSVEHLATPHSSLVLPDYFQHMIYSAAGITPSALSNPEHGRIDTHRKHMGGSFQSPQDRSDDQEESGRSCQSDKQIKQIEEFTCLDIQPFTILSNMRDRVLCCDYSFGLNLQDMKIHAKEIIIVN